MFQRISALLAVLWFGSAMPSTAGAASYSIGNYQLIGSSQITRTVYEYTYKASLTNATGTDIVSATATVTSKVTTTTVQQGNLTFGAVPAGGSVVSSDTFTIRQDRTVLMDWGNLVWSIQVKAAPIANAGTHQWVPCTSLVTLDGSGSTDPNGLALTYAWSWVTKPAGSSASLSNPAAVKPTFSADKVGDYRLQLIVSDSTPLSSAPAFVIVSTDAVPPTANAGSGRTVTAGTLVQLDGSASSDPAGLALTYAWSWVSRPAGTAAALAGATTVNPSFTVDRAGDYVVRLIVSNGYYNSAPAQVTITTTNTPPVANAGANRHVHVGTPVTLNGSGSTDVNGDPLTYNWSFNSRPNGSAASLSNSHSVMPGFTPDVLGDFVVQLVVNDGTADSTAATVTITTDPVTPTARAGSNQNLKAGSVIHLDGSGSTSGNNLSLAYSWSFNSRPAGSTAVFNDATAVNPTFTADKVGTYVAQLIVSDVMTSTPSTVTITSSDVAPVANAGSPQVVPVGTIVTLDGTGSTDVDGDPLTYTWSLTTVPTGSTAALSSTSLPKPTFTVDLSGNYVAQLIVGDGFLNSTPVTVTVSTQNLPPGADAGPAQQVSVGATVTLDGSASKDFNGLPLSYSWTLTTRPPQSTATLQNPTSVHPSFVADKGGNYVAQLTVSDSLNPAGSTPATVNVSTNNIAPVARPGSNQNVQVGDTVHLDGAASTSTSGYALTYSWSFNSIPNGSAAILANSTSATPSFTADEVGTYIVQLIVNDSIQNSTPATVTITAAQNQVITVNLNSNSSLTFATVGGSVHLSVPAGPGGVTANLASDKPAAADVPSTVTVSNGTQDASFTVTIGSGTGLANITGSLGGWTSGSSGITVNARTGSVALFQPLIGAGRSFAGTVTLNDPAPANGASLNVNSDNSAAATAAGPAIIGGGQTTGTFTVTGGATNGTANIGVSNAGYAITRAALTQTSAVINLASGVTVAPGNNATLPVTLSQPAPAGATVSLAASPSGIITVPSTVPVSPGASAPNPQPQVSGVALGTAQVTAAAPGYAPDTQSVTVQTALTLSTVNLQVKTDNTADVTVSSTSPAGPSGLIVTVQIDDTTIATAPPAVLISAGQSSATITVTGVKAGSTTLHVSAPAATGTSATVTVSTAPALTPVFSAGSAIIGKDLQASAYVTLGAAAPPGNIQMTVTSSDPNLVLLSAASTGDGSAAGGSGSINVTIAPNATQSPAFYVQSLVSSGTATLTVTLIGYAKGTATVTLGPSGFTLFPSTFTVQTFADATLTVYAGRLNASHAIVDHQGIRPGIAPLNVTLTSGDTSIGTVASPVTLAAGVTQNTTTFHGVNGGTTTVSLTEPAGYDPLASPASSTATVTAASIHIPASLEIGKDLQDVGVFYLNQAPPVATTMTISSDSPNLVFSRDRTVLGTSNILDTNLAAGEKGNEAKYGSGNVYMQALTDSGTATVTVHAQGFTDATFTVTFRSSGIALLQYSVAITTRTFTTNDLTNQSFWLFPVRVTASGRYLAQQMLGPRVAPLTANLTISDSNLATWPASAQITVGSTASASFTFDPSGIPGPVTIGVTQPAGFVAPNDGGSPTPVSYASMNGTITAPLVTVTPASHTIGPNLQYPISFSLPNAVPGSSAITVSIASSDPNVVLSRTITAAGSQTLSPPFTVNAGATSVGSVYVQVIGQPAGPVTITATPSKYFDKNTATVSIGKSGFLIGSSQGCNSRTLNTTTLASDATVWICPALVNDSQVWVENQAARPGLSTVVSLTNTDATVGTVPSSITYGGGTSSESFTFHNLGTGGNTTVSLTQPTGFLSPYWVGLPADQLAVSISAPTITASAPNVGFGLQVATNVSLQTAIPAGGRTATVASDNANLLVYNAGATPVRGTSIQIPLAANATTFALTYEATASSGTANVSISIPGYSTRTVVVTLYPSGFYFNGTTLTINAGDTRNVAIISAALDPVTGNFYQQQPLRGGGGSQTVGVVSGNTSAATVSPDSLSVAAGTSNKIFTVTGVATGTAVVTLTQPSGFSTPNNYYALTVTVN